MKLKLVIVDLEIPRTVKKRMLRIGVPAAVLLGGGVALAASLHTWNDGDTLNSADLNGNFSALQTSIGGVPLASPFTPTAGQLLAYDGSAWTPTSVSATTGKHYAVNHTSHVGVLEKYTAASPFTVETLAVNAPSAGVVIVSTDGVFDNWVHTSGTADAITCKLAPNALNPNPVTGSAPLEWDVGADVPTWGPIGEAFTMSYATSFPFAVPAAGTYEFDLTCYATCADTTNAVGATYGCDVLTGHIYGVFVPGTETAN